MMSLGSPRRMWCLIGAAGTVAIVALGWVLLVSGEKSRKTDLQNQAADSQVQIATDRNKINALQAENKKLPKYRAQLAALNAALPHGSSTGAFANDMRNLEKICDVQITALTFTPPTTAATGPAPAAGSESSAPAAPGTAAPVAAATLPELSMTLSAQGSAADLQRFLAMLQRTESRVVVVKQANIASPGGAGAKPTLSVTMTAFVANS